MKIIFQKIAVVVCAFSFLFAMGITTAADHKDAKKSMSKETAMQLKAAKLSPKKIQRNWKKQKWQTYERQAKLKASQGGAAIPETDCPPLPTQDCLDTWEVKK